MLLLAALFCVTDFLTVCASGYGFFNVESWECSFSADCDACVCDSVYIFFGVFCDLEHDECGRCSACLVSA